MNVLSLFDGISCGQIALQRLNISVEKYYASEIDKYAISVAQDNYPNTVQLGDVTKWKEWDIDWSSIDLLIGGSPCQGFSFSGKQLAFDDPRSKLFFIYVDILNHIKSLNPSMKFLLENVRMKQEYLNIITNTLQVEPVLINSSLVSAQNRQRYYWCNWPITIPEDKGIKLRDVLEPSSEHLNKATIVGRRLNSIGRREDYNKSLPIIQCIEVRAANKDKSNCLTTVEKDNILTPLPVGRHKGAYSGNLLYRNYTLVEYCRLQTVPDAYFPDSISESRAKKMLGNGWTVDVISHLLNSLPNVK